MQIEKQTLLQTEHGHISISLKFTRFPFQLKQFAYRNGEPFNEHLAPLSRLHVCSHILSDIVCVWNVYALQSVCLCVCVLCVLPLFSLHANGLLSVPQPK